MTTAFAMIMGGGSSQNLSVLTEVRAEPAVPFGGKFRLIDFPLSNCVNSDIYNVAVLTQYRPRSLNDHIGIGKPWDCSQTGTPGAFVVNIWTPGNEPMQTTQDLAVPLLANAKLVMNIHYHPAGIVHEPDSTEIDLRTSKTWPKKMYFVAGFGNIAQVPAEKLLLDYSDAQELLAGEKHVVEHMNDDHADAIALYAIKLLNLPAGNWRMTGCDPEGIDIATATQRAFLPFPTRATTVGEAGGYLKSFAKQARSLEQ